MIQRGCFVTAPLSIEACMWQISLIFTNIQILNIIKLFNDSL